MPAGLAETPAESEYTSACDRIRAHMQHQQKDLGQDATPGVSAESADAWLAPLFLDEGTDGAAEDKASRVDSESVADPAAFAGRLLLKVRLSQSSGSGSSPCDERQQNADHEQHR